MPVRGSGAVAYMMEDLVFMGRDVMSERAALSPDIRLRPCLLSVRCSRQNTPEADLMVLVKVCVRASTHVFKHVHPHIQSAE